MSFTDWKKAFDDEVEKAKGIPLIKVREPLSLYGKDGFQVHYIICVGDRNGAFKPDRIETDQPMVMSGLRPLYTNNKEVFAEALEGIREQVKDQTIQARRIANALTEKQVPELVMRRMQGEDVGSGDGFELLKQGVRKKLGELWARSCDLPRVTGDFEVSGLVAGNEFSLDINGALNYWRGLDVRWGELVVEGHPGNFRGAHGNPNTILMDNLEQGIYFLANFEIIMNKVEEIHKWLEGLGKIMGK